MRLSFGPHMHVAGNAEMPADVAAILQDAVNVDGDTMEVFEWLLENDSYVAMWAAVHALPGEVAANLGSVLAQDLKRAAMEDSTDWPLTMMAAEALALADLARAKWASAKSYKAEHDRQRQNATWALIKYEEFEESGGSLGDVHYHYYNYVVATAAADQAREMMMLCRRQIADAVVKITHRDAENELFSFAHVRAALDSCVNK